jgi:hypothetical protein
MRGKRFVRIYSRYDRPRDLIKKKKKTIRKTRIVPLQQDPIQE